MSALWEAIRAREAFTVREIVDACRLTQQGVQRMLDQLEAQGAVERCGLRGTAQVWRLTEAGRALEAAPGETAEQRMWLAYRRMRELTPRELVAHVATDALPVSERQAKAYCAVLLRAGYLRCMVKAAPQSGREARYRLIRDTGPAAPREELVRVIRDPNTGEMLGLPEGLR